MKMRRDYLLQNPQIASTKPAITMMLYVHLSVSTGVLYVKYDTTVNATIGLSRARPRSTIILLLIMFTSYTGGLPPATL